MLPVGNINDTRRTNEMIDFKWVATIEAPHTRGTVDGTAQAESMEIAEALLRENLPGDLRISAEHITEISIKAVH